MNILIITTYFPPDSTIAAIRPYMFAKYLARSGHKVTVLRSGDFFRAPDRSYPALDGLKVISYLGKDSPAEAFERGELRSWSLPESKSRISFLPEKIRLPIAKAYHSFANLWAVERMKHNIKVPFDKQKKVLNSLRTEGERFDVIFATYGNLENIYAGKYASELFDCPWILDFRDPIAMPFHFNGLSLSRMKHFQDQWISQADACTVVSNGLRESSKGFRHSKKTATIYNGYEFFEGDGGGTPEPDVFSLCYTGMLYDGKRDITPLLKALKLLYSEGKIDLTRVRIDHAGPDFQYMQAAAETLGMTACLADHGYVTRDEASRLQKSSDIFLLLSWNTQIDKGVISGKFYEGIRCGRPILALIAGDTPDSELYELNETYHYGFCYEECRPQQFQQLCDFLLQAYRQKMEHGSLDYAPSEEFSTAFRYDTLTKKLETLCEKLIRERLQA